MRRCGLCLAYGRYAVVRCGEGGFKVQSRALRRALSILLLTVVSLPLFSFLFEAGKVSGSVPICCRNNGRHHCLLSGAMETASANGSARVGEWFSAPVERCPFLPRVVQAAHTDAMALVGSAGPLEALMSHPASVARTESKWRIARDRSRQKRGPPSFLG